MNAATRFVELFGFPLVLGNLLKPLFDALCNVPCLTRLNT